MIEEHRNTTERDDARILQDRARMLSRQLETGNARDDILHLLTFTLGQERYGIEITYVKEVQPIKHQMWSEVPCAPRFIAGVVTIRGHIYSMMHIGRFFGAKTHALSENAHLVMITNAHNESAGAMELCLVSDDIPRIEPILPESIQPAPDAISQGTQAYIHGVAAPLLMVLNAGRLLSDPAVIVDEDV